MKVRKFLKNFLKSSFCYFSILAIVINSGLTLPTFAKVILPTGRDEEFSQNDILFYNPDGCDPGSSAGGSSGSYVGEETWDGSCTSVTTQRASWLSRQVSAMQDVASANGLPWELIAGQALSESGGGSSEVCPYNPLGLKGSGPSCDGRHRTFSSYQDAYQHYVDNIKSIREIKNMFPSDPYSAIAYIQYGVPHGQSYAQCSRESYLTDPSHPCYGHQLGDPTPGYVNRTSSLICGIQKWAKENGYAISRVTWENYSTTSSSDSASDDSSSSDDLSTKSTSGAKWNNGWLEDNSIPGIIKEDAATTSLSETPQNAFDGGSPNKILLHSTEGTSVGLAAYPSNNKFPAHFTIDLKKRIGYQHFPLNKPSIAIKSYDTSAGIQIEIVGFSDTTAQSASRKSSPYFLPNLSNEDWDYLAVLLIAIANETGIPLTSSVTWTGDGSGRLNSAAAFKNYTGILGHQHAYGNDHIDPGPIWSKVSDAIQRNPDAANIKTGTNNGYGNSNSTTYCNRDGSSSDSTPPEAGNLADFVKKWAWPDYHSAPYVQQMPAYAEYINNNPPYSGANCPTGEKGNDCGAFVSNIIIASGWDTSYSACATSCQKSWLDRNWNRLTVRTTDDLRLGDVGYRNSGGHVILYVGNISGFNSKTASASDCRYSSRRSPMAGSESDSTIVNSYTWYRKK